MYESLVNPNPLYIIYSVCCVFVMEFGGARAAKMREDVMINVGVVVTIGFLIMHVYIMNCIKYRHKL